MISNSLLAYFFVWSKDVLASAYDGSLSVFLNKDTNTDRYRTANSLHLPFVKTAIAYLEVTNPIEDTQLGGYYTPVGTITKLNLPKQKLTNTNIT